MRFWTTLVCLAAWGTLLTSTASADMDYPNNLDYPKEPVRIIVPFSPGDAMDNTARVMAERMRWVLGVPVIVQNIAGDGGAQGLAEAARAPADGYTLVMVSTGVLTAGPLITNSGVQPSNFAPLAQLVENPLAVAVADSSPYADMKELVNAAKEQPLSYATPGAVSKQRICMAQFARDHSLTLNHFSAQGGTGAVRKVLNGDVDFVFTAAPVFVPMVRSGKLRVLGVGAEARVSYLAHVPTFRELGYAIPDRLWFGLLVRAETPEPIRRRLEETVRDAASQPETKALYRRLNFTDAYLDAVAFQEVIDADLASHRVLLHELGLLKK